MRYHGAKELFCSEFIVLVRLTTSLADDILPSSPIELLDHVNQFALFSSLKEIGYIIS